MLFIGNYKFAFYKVKIALKSQTTLYIMCKKNRRKKWIKITKNEEKKNCKRHKANANAVTCFAKILCNNSRITISIVYYLFDVALLFFSYFFSLAILLGKFTHFVIFWFYSICWPKIEKKERKKNGHKRMACENENILQNKANLQLNQ